MMCSMKLSLVGSLALRDFTERYSGSILGFGWGIIGPLVNILIYTLIFSQIMNARLPGATGEYSYSIYLVSGLLPWLAFSSVVTRSVSVFLDQKHIISKVQISLPKLPLVIAASESLTFVISLLIFFVILLMSGQVLNKWMLLLPFLFLAQQLFGYALGFILAQLTVFLRDTKQLTAMVMHVWFWLTPIVYVKDILPEQVRTWMAFNPMVHFTGVWQSIFVHQQVPNLTGTLLVTVLSSCLLILGLWMHHHLERDIRDTL